jgi:hypothetical protein
LNSCSSLEPQLLLLMLIATTSIPSMNWQWVLPIFNHVTKFFRELRTNYLGVGTKKLCILQEFQCRPHESLWDAYVSL